MHRCKSKGQAKVLKHLIFLRYLEFSRKLQDLICTWMVRMYKQFFKTSYFGAYPQTQG